MCKFEIVENMFTIWTFKVIILYKFFDSVQNSFKIDFILFCSFLIGTRI